MARQGLMDDSGYDFFDVSDCANYESCREEAFNDGYAKGRADKYQEIISEYMLLTEEQVAEIRTEAIDEFIKGCKATHDGLICNWDKPYGITFERMEEIAEQLKEQNNGK